MRNLKKILALALALVMTLSVMSVASAKKLGDYTDSASVSAEYETAVDVATQLGVLNGMTETEFGASGYLTRVQLAAIIYRLTTGDVSDKYRDNFVAGAAANFDDVTDDYWAAGYIGYCADAGFLEGWGGKFWPGETMRGYEALAALLRAIGYNQPDQFSGTAWTVAVAQIARDTGVSAGVVTDLNKPITREQFAQFIYNALWTPMVSWTPAYGYQTAYVDSAETIAKTLVRQTFQVTTGKAGVAGEADIWGRPSTMWYKSGSSTPVISIADDYVARYTTMVDECDIAEELGLTDDANLESAFLNGVKYEGANSDSSVWKYLGPKDITSDEENDIGLLDYTSVVGEQGRITEVYDMGTVGGVKQLRLVEISTYLAKVEKVVNAVTDKNEHSTTPHIELTVYVPASTDSNNDGHLMSATNTVTLCSYDTSFAKGDYVLVTSNLNSTLYKAGFVDSIKAANVGAVSSITGFTADKDNETVGTTTLGATLYSDSDMLVLVGTAGGDKTVGQTGKVITDDYGNLIGIAPVDTNYMVIEKIEWKHSASSVGGGYAMANVILSDGTKLSGVTVSSVTTRGEGTAAAGDTPAVAGKVTTLPANNTTDTFGNPSSANVSDDYTNNGDWKVGDAGDTVVGYYNHLWTYTVNEDGSYNIVQVDDGDVGLDTAGDYTGLYDDSIHEGQFGVIDLPNATDTDKATYDQTIATISTRINKVVATDNTIFLYKNLLDGYTYTVYVGADNAPSVTEATMCILLDDYGYADVVVVSNYEPAASSFLAYVLSDKPVTYSTLGAGYEVWKAGETTPTLVWDKDGTAWDSKNMLTSDGTGWFQITLNSLGQIALMDDTCYAAFDIKTTDDTDATNFSAGLLGTEKIERVAVAAPVVGNSFQAADYEKVNAKTGAATIVTDDTAESKVQKDFRVSSSTAVFVVTKGAAAAAEASIRQGTLADIKANDVAFVKYTEITGGSDTIYRASAVYVVRLNVAAAQFKWTAEADRYVMETEIGFGAIADPVTVKLNGKDVTLSESGDNADYEVDDDGVTVELRVLNENGQEVYSNKVKATITNTGELQIMSGNTLTPGASYKLVVDSISFTFAENDKNDALGISEMEVTIGNGPTGTPAFESKYIEAQDSDEYKAEDGG